VAFIGHHSGGMIFVISSSYCKGNQLLTGKIKYQTGNEANWFFLKNLRQRKAYTISRQQFREDAGKEKEGWKSCVLCSCSPYSDRNHWIGILWNIESSGREAVVDRSREGPVQLGVPVVALPVFVNKIVMIWR